MSGSKATNHSNDNNQSAAKGPIMGNEGRPEGKTAIPPGCPDNPEARCSTVWSEEAKKIILIELTFPWEENCEQAFERKSAKYQDLFHDCREKG